ncbi:MAG: hypothetical protein ACI9QL_003681 [Candidatus Omnitrophota bacterium]|jgi:hypothetical protein
MRTQIITCHLFRILLITVAIIGNTFAQISLSDPLAFKDAFVGVHNAGPEDTTLRFNYLLNTQISTNPTPLKAWQAAPAPEGYQGALVLSADQAIAAVQCIPGAAGIRTYTGITSTSRVAYVHELQHLVDGTYSQLSIMNVSTQAVPYNVTYDDAISVSSSIPPMSSVRLNQQTEGHALGYRGTAVITADQPIAAMVSIEGPSGDLSLVPGFHQGATEIIFPLILRNQNGQTSSIQLQNLDPANDLEVDITILTTSASNPFGNSFPNTLAPGAAASLNNVVDALPSGRYTARIRTTNGQPLLGGRCEVNRDEGAHYSAKQINETSTFTICPLVIVESGGRVTRIQTMNVGTNRADEISFSFSGTDRFGSPLSEGARVFNINPNVTHELSLDNFPSFLEKGFYGSVTIESSGPPLAVSTLTESATEQAAYAAIADTQAARHVLFPYVEDRIVDVTIADLGHTSNLDLAWEPVPSASGYSVYYADDPVSENFTLVPPSDQWPRVESFFTSTPFTLQIMGDAVIFRVDAHE